MADISVALGAGGAVLIFGIIVIIACNCCRYFMQNSENNGYSAGGHHDSSLHVIAVPYVPSNISRETSHDSTHPYLNRQRSLEVGHRLSNTGSQLGPEVVLTADPPPSYDSLFPLSERGFGNTNNT